MKKHVMWFLGTITGILLNLIVWFGVLILIAFVAHTLKGF